MLLRLLSSLIVAVVLAAAPLGAAFAQTDAGIAKFFGSFVGTGTATLVPDKTTEKRDLDVTLEAFKDDGFTIKWITVVRGADGERVSDDVKRREVIENFTPLEGKENVYILAPKGGLFQKAELPNPLRGEPMRWATVDNDVITIYSMAITDAGGSELQVYRRKLTERGLDVSFLRLQDEVVEVEMDGTLVRAQ